MRMRVKLLLIISTLALLNHKIQAEWVENQIHRRQTEDFNSGGLPRHLPSPPHKENKGKVAKTSTTTSRSTSTSTTASEPIIEEVLVNTIVSSTDDTTGYFYPYYYYPHEGNGNNFENISSEALSENFLASSDDEAENEDETEDEDEDEDETEDEAEDEHKENKDEKEEKNLPAPLGLDETILIIVPQFKFTLHGFPAWAGASVRMSLPMTIFFEELKWPSPPTPHTNKLSTTGFWNFLLKSVKFSRLNHQRKSRSILSLPPGQELIGGERAILIPKIERFLRSFGINSGRECLLRTVCEVHDAQVHRNYGFLGEFLTTIFSISNSIFAETHLASYLKAERKGRKGNCSKYYKKCPYSLFQQTQTGRQCEKYMGSGSGSGDCTKF